MKHIHHVIAFFSNEKLMGDRNIMCSDGIRLNMRVIYVYYQGTEKILDDAWKDSKP